MLIPLAYVWRSWKNDKGLALFAVAALAIGIACATTIFSVVDTVFLKSLPYTHAARWVALFGGSTVGTQRDNISGMPLSDVSAYRERTSSFDVFGWYTLGGDFNLTSPGQPQHIDGVEVTPSLVDNLGVNPIAGRLFTPADGLDVALISSELWSRLGANPAIVGQSITLSGHRYTVTGVMPRRFRLPLVDPSGASTQNAVWIPAKPPADESQRRTYGFYSVYARLKPGVTFEQARADAEHAAAGIVRESPADHHAYTAALFSLRESIVRDIRSIFLLLLGAAGLLLLITCANVAGLLVARSVGRARETAVRVALGAGYSQLASQFFLEALSVSVVAAIPGALASVALVKIVVSLAAQYIPRSEEVSIDWRALLFALAVACFSALLSALAPLWQSLRTQPNEVLTEGARASSGARSRRLSQSLVVAEIALAFTLLSISALLLSQLARLTRTSPGFDPADLLTFNLNSSVPDPARQAYHDRLLRELKVLPGVTGVAFANQIPLTGCCYSGYAFPEGRPVNQEFARPVSLMLISTDYFSTLRIPLRRGRLLTEHDTNEMLIPVVIDEAAVKRYFSDREPIGALGHLGTPTGPKFQVVGVVGDVHNEGLPVAARPEIYLSSALAPVNPMRFVVRSRLSTAALVTAIRRAVQKIDFGQPIYGVRTMPEIVSDSLTAQRLPSLILTFFAGAALLMASLGIYSVTSYAVRQRTVEMGTRMALGAVKRDLLRLIVGNGLRMALQGMAIGAVATAAAAWMVARFFNAQADSPLPYLYSIAIVTLLAACASLFPAWRATLLSPMVAIRDEPDSLWAAARRNLQRVIGPSSRPEAGPTPDATLLTELMDASRNASSFSEALQRALATLREAFQSESAMLFEYLPEQQYRCIAALPAPPADSLALPENGFLLNRVRFYNSPLAFTPEDLDSALHWASEHKPQYAAEIASLRENSVRLAVALRAKTGIIGLLLLGPPVGRNQYSSANRKLLPACAQQFALMIQNARLTDRVIEQEAIRRDVALAVEVQKRLLPETFPGNGSGSLAAFSLPARSVGGDYFDFFDIGDHRIGIALADVSGKGIAAALIMAVVHASLRIIAADGNIPLPELAAKMNRFLHRSTGSTSYATFFYAQFEADDRRLRYVNAGHNPPYLVRALHVQSNGDESLAPIEELATGGMVIGLFPHASYQEAVVDLHPGDVLVAFTDGVTEALNPAGEEFGEARLKELLRRLAGLTASEMTSRISQELRNWIAEAPQHDDLTVIALKVN